MGTRADFYIGRGMDAKWVGSIAWDGYPEGIQPKNGRFQKGRHLFDATSEKLFTKRLGKFFDGRNDVSRPSDGWPWPWEDSRTTDYAYALDEGKVWASCFGGEWFDPHDEEPESDSKVAVFPNMKSMQRVTLGQRSGLIVIGTR